MDQQDIVAELRAAAEHVWPVTGKPQTPKDRSDRDSANTMRAAASEIETLRDVLRPFAEFARQWDRQPIRNIDDEFYRIHSGTEYEAGLRLSDLRRAASVLRARVDELEEGK